ncbi:hypothetical protein [Alienimonas sp. DA493]|uniref:hypothetical protein n=1 Tax=Alienimonas sp. DA493 TaxID=3373605 RepID=UPI0037544ABA
MPPDDPPNPGGRPRSGRDRRLSIRVSDDDLEAFHGAAKRAGMLKPSGEPYLTAWVLDTLRRSAARRRKREADG